MKLNLLTAGAMLLACAGMANAQTASTSSGNATHYTREQLKQMMRDAHTPEQFSTLAAYYGAERQTYLQKAAEEKLEWERRSQNVVSVAAKYPRPVDSARYLYEYYMEEAAETGALSAKYGRMLALPDSSAKPQ
jgi:hypothetical protein